MNIRNIELVSIKVFTSSFLGGFGNTFNDGIETKEVDIAYIRNVKEPYLVVVTGDSMAPKIEPKDELVVDTHGNVRSGKVCAVNYNGDFLIKIYLETESGYVLRSINPKYPDITIKDDDTFNVLGLVVKIIKNLN